jgi:hypothetical protein
VRLERHPLAPRHRRVEGYLVGESAQLVLLHRVDEGYRLDGHSIVRRDSRDAIVELARDEPRRAVIVAALRLRRQRPRALAGLDLSAMREALVTASDAHALVAIYREQADHELCEVGRVRMSTATTYVLDALDAGARWEHPPRRHPFAEVTRIDIGTAYERVLALVAEAWGHPHPADAGRGARPPAAARAREPVLGLPRG